MEVQEESSNIFSDTGFEDFLSSLFQLKCPPRADAIDKGEYYLILLDLPGIESKDIDITFLNGKLTVEGKGREKEKDVNYVFSNRKYGPFSWSIDIPWLEKTEDIEAEMKNGVLHLRVKKSKTSPRPQKVEVKSRE